MRSLIWGLASAWPLLDFQITGGSNSVRAWEMPLRAAGRDRARNAGEGRRPALAGGLAGGVDTAGGFVVYKANRLPFHDIIADLDPDDAPDEPTLRTTRRLAGQPVMRLDIPAKVDGSARFGIDVRLPGMAYAAIAQGPIGATPAPLGKPRCPGREAGAGSRLRRLRGRQLVCRAQGGARRCRSVARRARMRPGPWQIAAVKGALAADGKPFGPPARIGKWCATMAMWRRAASGACSPPNTACPSWPMPAWNR
jgi:isoquinoline 1-oxidoreductase subunit beta